MDIKNQLIREALSGLGIAGNFKTKTAAQRRKEQIRDSLEKAQRLSVETGQAFSFLALRLGEKTLVQMMTICPQLQMILCGQSKVIFVTSQTQLTSPDPQENEIDHFYNAVICDGENQWYIFDYFAGRGPGGSWRNKLKHRATLKKVDIETIVRFIQQKYPLILAEMVRQNFLSQGSNGYWV